MRRRDRPAADPEAVEALAVLDRYKAMLEALREAGDPWAPGRLQILWWARHDIEQWGMDDLSQLRVKGYRREVARLTTAKPEVLHPVSYHGPASTF